MVFENTSVLIYDLNEKLCACKGIRHCRLCDNTERVKNLKPAFVDAWKRFNDYEFFIYNPNINMACASKKINSNSTLETIYEQVYKPNFNSTKIYLKGLVLIENFLTEAEETILLKKIDNYPWNLSQSGRRKQVCFHLTNFYNINEFI